MRGARIIHGVQEGFTLVEVSIIIIVLSILAAIMIDAAKGYQIRARDSERISDIDVISRSLERMYRTQASAIGATYPPTSIGATGLAAIVESTDAITAPDQSSASLSIAMNNAPQNPTNNQYIYQPLLLDGSLCTTMPCVRYKLYYRPEQTDAVVIKESMKQQ